MVTAALIVVEEGGFTSYLGVPHWGTGSKMWRMYTWRTLGSIEGS